MCEMNNPSSPAELVTDVYDTLRRCGFVAVEVGSRLFSARAAMLDLDTAILVVPSSYRNVEDLSKL
jgi:hypothetical protein